MWDPDTAPDRFPGSVLELHRHPEVATPVVPGPDESLSVVHLKMNSLDFRVFRVKLLSTPNLDIIIVIIRYPMSDVLLHF